MYFISLQCRRFYWSAGAFMLTQRRDRRIIMHVKRKAEGMAMFFQRGGFQTEHPLKSVDIHAARRPDFNLERPAVAAVLDGRIPAPDQDMSDALKNALSAVYGRNLEWRPYFDAVPKGCVGIKLRIVETGAFFRGWEIWNGSVKIDLEVHDFQTLPLRCFTVPIAAERPLFNRSGKTADKAAASAWERAAAQLIGCIDKALQAIRDGADLEAAFNRAPRTS